MLAATIATACALLPLALGAPESERITSLPGLEGDLPFKMYSGYLPVGKTSGNPGMIHYWFIEARENPSSSPVVYWTNGGPGGSGIAAGLLTEMGAVHVQYEDDEDASSKLKVVENPYGWNNVANTLYVSQPKGVGYSYCLDKSKTCNNNDESAAQDAYDAMNSFYEKFPEYKKNDLYLTAESYGGIYIPTMLNEMDTRGGFPNLKGAAIGDGCWGSKVGMCAFQTAKSMQITTEFRSGHAMIPQTLYQEAQEACDNYSSDSAVQSKACEEVTNKMDSAVGNFDIYNIYDTCGNDQAQTQTTHREQLEAHFGKNGQVSIEADHKSKPHHNVGGALNDYPCGMGGAASEWLSDSNVAKALHVKTTGQNSFNYTWGPAQYSGDLRPLYKKLAQKYSILIYSGDTDACVPFWGTEEWTRELGFPVSKQWQPWHSEHMDRPGKQRAGYVIEYEAGKNHPFWFATVQGAGHMVPTYKPHFALQLLKNFIEKKFD